MFESTFKKALGWTIAAALLLTLYFVGCFDWIKKENFVNFFNGYSFEGVCYTDLDGDVLSNVDSFFVLNPNENRVKMFLKKNWDDSYLENSMALILNTNPNFDKFEKKAIAGYYSVGFIANTKQLDQIASSFDGNSYDEAVIDFSKILNAYINDKDWRDIGIDLDGKVSIKNPHGEGSFWNELVKYQILLTISGENKINSTLMSEYEEEVNDIFEKMSNEVETDSTIKITTEQSNYFCSKSADGYATANSIAAIPIYICWNNEYYDQIKSAITENGWPIKYYG